MDPMYFPVNHKKQGIIQISNNTNTIQSNETIISNFSSTSNIKTSAGTATTDHRLIQSQVHNPSLIPKER
jgi:hypothetical protein